MQWITAAHRDPFGPATWQITSDVTTPVELLGDVHIELLDLYLEDRHSDKDHLFQSQTSAQEAYVPLLTHGWRPHDQDRRHPDLPRPRRTEPLERTVKDIPFFTRHHVSIATTTAKQNKPFRPVAAPPPRPAMSRTR
ncbi:DUF317 domain-containing protein [Streptomyces sp. NPDC014802]|uniref:DUF317 domain-containing protein n=1 Tax=Streptomyces sp. NPDC014802 TaxID=3364917 RepID=UPI0036FE0788